MFKLIITTIALAVFSVNAWANPIAGDTCGVPDRVAFLEGTQHCAYGEDNPDADDLAGYYGDDWMQISELTGNGTDGLFSATVTTIGGWDNIPNSGTWAIDASFWSMYGEAVISMHIGNGAGDPDHWAWLVVNEETYGNWSLDYIDGGTGKGGGLSNLKLWGRGIAVPEPAVVWLLSFGLIGMMGMSRLRKAA